MPMATKLDGVVTYNVELPLIKSNDFSIMLFFEVTWKINYIIPPLAPEQ